MCTWPSGDKGLVELRVASLVGDTEVGVHRLNDILLTDRGHRVGRIDGAGVQEVDPVETGPEGRGAVAVDRPKGAGGPRPALSGDAGSPRIADSLTGPRGTAPLAVPR